MSSYNRELVEHLAPAIWDLTYSYGMRSPYQPDDDMPRSKLDPKTGGTLFAHLADMRRAWAHADVPQVERQAMLLRFGLGWTVQAIGDEQGVDKVTAMRRSERAVGRLVAYLNGKTYRDAQDGDGPVLTD